MSDYNSQFTPLFKENLMLTLKLESDGKEGELSTGFIQHVTLNMHSYGYDCHVKFFTRDNDELYQIMSSPKILKATLTFKRAEPEKEGETILELKGIVTPEKTFTRLPSDQNNMEQSQREYEIYFWDNAKATWEQHFPTNVYVDESMKDILTKHGNPEVTIDYKWDPLEIKHPVTAFSLYYKYWLKPDEQTSFYSFLNWYLHQENGLLTYDFKSNSYTITGKKKEASGKPLEVHELQSNPPKCFFSPPTRHNEKILKHTADNLENEDKENPNSFKLVRKEEFDPGNYGPHPKHARQKVKSPIAPEKNLFEVDIKKFTDEIHLDKLTPGSFLGFKGDKEGNWSRDSCIKDKKFRIRSMAFTANRFDLSEKNEKPTHVFLMTARAVLEEEEENHAARPRFIPPAYPFYIQGKVFCDIGEKEQSTFKIQESEKSPKGLYLVKVPLAGNKKVVAPFDPDISAQFYNPFKKETKVMLSLHFNAAEIVGPIDWDPHARLPKGVQGDRIVLASNGKDKYTFIQVEYVNGKDPVYTIKQSSSAEQTQTLQIKEKEFMVTVENKGKKVLSFLMNLDTAIVITHENKEAGTLQQFTLNGETITTTCKGKAGKSEIIQKPDAVDIQCKKFTVKSDMITLEAANAIMMKGKNMCRLQTKLTNIIASAVKMGA